MTERIGDVADGAWRDAAVAAADVVLVWAPESGTALAAGAGTDPVYGVAPDEFVGAEFDALPAEDGDDGRLLSRATAGDHVTVERHERLDGHDSWVEHTLVPDGNGNVLDLASDVTEQRARERELEQFASTVAHDLKEPLNTASATLSLARREDDDGGYLADLEAVHDRMGELVDEVLTLAKQGETVGSPESVELSVAAREAWKSVDAPEATLRVDDGLGAVDADPERLRTLFENLLTNAVVHGGSAVTVRVESMENGVAVVDDGVGVTPAATERLFERGYSTAADGTGFGLAIVGRIARAHGWTITHTESEDGGTRFELRFD